MLQQPIKCASDAIAGPGPQQVLILLTDNPTGTHMPHVRHGVPDPLLILV